jgi:hypothetical protein
MMDTNGKEFAMKEHRMWRRLSAAFAASSMVVLTGAVLAQDTPAGCIQPGAPKMLDGQVVQIDPEKGKVTLRESSGATHDFRASAETLRSYKVGDRIQATLRPGPGCNKSAS